MHKEPLMTLLEDIQNAAIDAESDLGTLLRKCKLLATRLGSKPLEDWVLWESNGYPDGIEVPDYRAWPLQVKGYFSGLFGSYLKNAPIPYACLPMKARQSYQRYECRLSIASVEMTIRETKLGNLRVPTGDLALALGMNVYQGKNCIHAWAEFGGGNLVELLNTVRNKILDFALAIWKEEPAAGEAKGNTGAVLKSSKVTQIFNTTIFGGSANLIGTANDSTVSINIITNDFKSLESVLRENGVKNEDLEKLETALKTDAQPISKDKFGPKVSSWIAKMIRKAADGSWKISLGAAGNLLAQAISKYYGL